eukprot:TRINITY_DN77923_c0_g1_i1.p1 TRINITY_DN77923_c0_g1~~TRINITY_DN77923_c0_g1_i1.p1  ORF type:complete len:424 (+),score=89.58 TRINITY_DN77923_c0_g1_i1:77-1348(+)
MASAAVPGLLLAAEECFNAETPISDHLPQVFRVPRAGIPIEVLTWNIMARGRCGKAGRAGTALEGQTLTNNGLDCDETPEAYESRLMQRVLPLMAAWFAGAGSERLRVACLQEFPAMPLIQEDALVKLRATGRDSLQLAVGPFAPGAGSEGEAQQITAYCNAVAWDSNQWPEPPLQLSSASVGPHALGIVFQAKATQNVKLQLLSLHMPFIDVPGGLRYSEGLKAAAAFLARLPRCTGESDLLVAAGDFNVDVKELCKQNSALDASIEFKDSSAVYRGQRITVDACATIQSRAGSTAGEIPAASSLSRSGQGLWRAEGPGWLGFFGTAGRDKFIARYINHGLQDDPRLWRLGDTAVATLALWPFTDQARELGRLLTRSKDTVSSRKRKRVLGNPLAGTGSQGVEDDSESEEDESEESSDDEAH